MADNLRLVSGGEDIKIWEPPNLRLLHTFGPHSQALSSLAWSPNNNFLASTTPGDKVIVTSFKGASQSSVELTGSEDDTCVAFNSTSRHLLTAGKSKVLNLWDLKTRAIKKKIEIPGDGVSCITFNWNDTTIASGTTAGDIYLHNVSTTQTSAALRLPKTQTIHSFHYSKFKKAFLGSVSDDGAMNIWDTNAKKIVASFPDQHTAPAMSLCFSPMNDMLLASAGLDKKIVFYDVVGKKVIKEMSAESPLTSLSFMHDGATFAVGSTRGKIYIFDLRSGSTPLHETVAHKTAVRCLSFQLQSKGGRNSSSTLAEKFTNRSTADTTKPSTTMNGVTSNLDGGTTAFMKRPAPPEPVQNGLKNGEEGDIFSPLRDGSTTSNNAVSKDLKPAVEFDQPISNTRKTDVSVSGVLSPIRNSMASYQPPGAMLPTNTHAQNGYPVTISMPNEKLPAQPLITSTPFVMQQKATSGSDVTGLKDQNKVQAKDAGRGSKVSSDNVKPTTSTASKLQDDLMAKIGESSKAEMKSPPNQASLREVLNKFIQPSNANNGEQTAGFQQFQIQFMKNLIDDSLDDFRFDFHREIVNLQVEMLRQFHIQQNEIKTLLQQYSLNDALLEENERLKEEIKRLKATH